VYHVKAPSLDGVFAWVRQVRWMGACCQWQYAAARWNPAGCTNKRVSQKWGFFIGRQGQATWVWSTIHNNRSSSV